MPTLGRYGRLPLKLGGGVRPIQAIHAGLLDHYRRFGLDVSEDSITWVEAYADACVLADIWKASKRIGFQLTPSKMLENLVDWETACGLYPTAADRVSERRARLGGKIRGFSGNNVADIRDACAAFLGRVFVGLNTTAESDEIVYWPAMNPGPPGLEWASNREVVRIQVRRTGTTKVEFERLMAGLVRLLDDMCPSTMAFSWFTDEGGFFIGSSGLGSVGL